MDCVRGLGGNSSLTHDLFHVANINSGEVMTLREQFKNVPVLLEVINALLELDQGVSLQKWKCTHHHTSEYMIEDRKLWRIAAGHHTSEHVLHLACRS